VSRASEMPTPAEWGDAGLAAACTAFIGTPTTGANGDVSGFMVPGGIRVPFTREDIRCPMAASCGAADCSPKSKHIPPSCRR
jgi:hypothetical protein